MSAALIALAVMASSPQAGAQTSPGARFEVPGGSLASALVVFGRQADLQVSYVPSVAAQASTSGVSGTMPPDAALSRLLAGTGLSFRFQDARTVVIERGGGNISAIGAVEGSILLDPIDVDGSGDGTDGFVPTRSASGTKTSTPILEIPQSISVVTRDELDARSVQSDAEALTYTPGVLAQPFGGAQHQQNPFFYIRGFSSAFGGSYVDTLQSFVNYRYEPYGYERYDIVRGPSSTLYGAGDPGGLVNRSSKMPTEEAFGEVKLQGGNYSRLQGAVDLGGPIDAEGQFLYRLTGLVRDADAPIDYDLGVTAPDERQYIAPALTWKPTDDTSFTVLGHYLNDKIGQENSFMWPDTRELTHIALAQPGLAEWNQEQYAIGYKLAHDFSEDLSFRQNFRYSHMESTMLGVYQSALLPDGHTVERYTDGNDEWRRDIVLDNQIQYRVRTGAVEHDLLAGFDYQNTTDWIAFNSGEAPDLDLWNPDYDQAFGPAYPWLQNLYKGEGYGLYAQDQIRFSNWMVTLAGRQDWSRSSNEDQIYGDPVQKSTDEKFTYRAGVTYLTDFGLAPYTSYSTSYLPQGGVDANNDPLKPTTGQQFEVGVKYQPTEWNALFTAAYFDLTKQNVPVYVSGAPVQVGEVRSRGFELQATTSLDNWDINGSYTYTDVKVTEDPFYQGKRPVLTPEHMASLWLNYTFDRGALAGLKLGAGVRYVGASYGDRDNTIENDAYTLVDAALTYDFGNLNPEFKGTELAVNATNLFGKEYVTCFSAVDCKWGATRTVYGTITHRW